MTTTTTATTVQFTVSARTTVMAISRVKLSLARKSAWKGGKAPTVSSRSLENQNALHLMPPCQQLHLVSDRYCLFYLIRNNCSLDLAGYDRPNIV